METWNEIVIRLIRRKEKLADRFDKAAEDARANGNEKREERMYARADRAEEYICGVLDTLEAIGYEIRFDSHHNVDSIIGSNSVQYRVRYKHTSFGDGAIFCDNGSEVQDVINRQKELGSEYKLVGIDYRMVFPNGCDESWCKIFDF